MFQKGEYVVYGSRGVCQIENRTTPDISGIDKKREYYVLKPVYATGSTVYIPVDAAKEAMRPVLSRQEAEQLIGSIPKISLIDGEGDRLLEQEYRNSMKKNCCEEWVRIIKTVHLHKKQRMETGRKATAMDARYIRIAEEALYGELAVSLKMDRGEVEDYIVSRFSSN